MLSGDGLDKRRSSMAQASSTQLLVPQLNLDSALASGFGHRGSRQAVVNKVYGQNLGKIADAKRKLHAKAFGEHLKQLPPGKNFIKENARKLSVQGASGETMKKLDRLRKLQEQTSKLRAQTALSGNVAPKFQ